MKTSVPRLRRVRFKDGRTIEVLRTKPTDDQNLRASIRNVMKVGAGFDKTLAGYAFVAWGTDGMSIAHLQSNGQIPSILVPDFVRNRLLAEKIEDWTIDTLNGN